MGILCVCVYVCISSSLRKVSVQAILVHVRPKAEEDPAAQHEDGGPPAEAVAPVELVIGLKNRAVDELDRVEHQSAGLQDHWSQRESNVRFH